MGRGEQGRRWGAKVGEKARTRILCRSVTLFLATLSPLPPAAIVLEADEWKIRPDDLESKAHLGGNPGIHLFLARSWTD